MPGTCSSVPVFAVGLSESGDSNKGTSFCMVLPEWWHVEICVAFSGGFRYSQFSVTLHPAGYGSALENVRRPQSLVDIKAKI